MTYSSDPLAEAIRTRRLIVAADIDRLWSEFIERRRSSTATLAMAESLLATVNLTHVASWGLSRLYGLIVAGTVDVDAHKQAREAWRAVVEAYDADPRAWDRSYYRNVVAGYARDRGTDRARAFAEKLVRAGAMTQSDVSTALAQT